MVGHTLFVYFGGIRVAEELLLARSEGGSESKGDVPPKYIGTGFFYLQSGLGVTPLHQVQYLIDTQVLL